ncbi:major facilitator superfamily domain-containing protein [Ilyonectria robusta]|uniref:major facilitator superfamily domain-containing protein n=1 Tax=Ilyonectria robusta TaxID=1079257 RepID=UPI001E8DAD97|nr:major facilitator superfamily domain-containing protein [Ilyonectria robusta]KAH8738440.1 major facilitator superfamily domain-containing protein [Ilyonectria robusta]
MISGPPLSSSSSSTTITDSRLEPQQATTSKILQKIELFAPAHIDQATALRHNYAGNGTVATPFIVVFLPNDPQDATTFSTFRKWMITCHQAVATLAVTFASSAYSGGIREIIRAFEVSHEVAILGVSLYVLGFAIGPLLWAPLSELYGRQRIFIITMMAVTAFNAGAAGATSMPALLVLRFFAGATGSSTLTNAGGVIADMFNASQRGLATSPIVGGFLSETEGWRWLHGLMAIFTGVLWILGTLFVPETYAPVLLRRRAQMLSKTTDRAYISTIDAGKPPKSLVDQCKTALTRPWVLLFKEPIVLLTSVYIAIIYGTLYLNFAAFPIVFQVERGWSPGIGGLPFIGTAVGVVLATLTAVFDNKRYTRLVAAKGGIVEPEARLPPAMVGSIMIPVGLFWFAWTCGPTIHWAVPIVGSVFFACGLVMVFLSLLNYLIDSYVVYAASILAANSVLRSVFGAVFPLFTQKMYENLGIHWASSIPAFLAVACVPFPFLFYSYGGRIRMKCEYASEAAKVLQKMRTQHQITTEDEAMVEAEEVWRSRSHSIA